MAAPYRREEEDWFLPRSQPDALKRIPWAREAPSSTLADRIVVGISAVGMVVLIVLAFLGK